MDTDASDYGPTAAAMYDARYPERVAEADAAAAFLGALAGSGTALELGIGTGRLALPLAARGVEVHGVDSSAAMVDRLRSKPGGERIHVVMGDFADVGSLVDRAYDLVFVAFNTLFELGSQDAQVRCFDGVASRLADGGAFVVEAFAPDPARADQDVELVELADDRAVLKLSRHDPVRQRVEGQEAVLTRDGIDFRPWRIRYSTVAEIDLMARLAGLRLRERFGGWHRQPYVDLCVAIG